MRRRRVRSIAELMRRLDDALARGHKILTLRRQDAFLLRRYFETDSIVSVGEVLEEDGVEFVDGLGRIGAVAELKKRGLIPLGYEPEKLLFERRYLNTYRGFLRDNGLFDVPLLLPRSSLAKFKGALFVFPHFLLRITDSFEELVDTALTLAPAERGVAEKVLIEAANIANQSQTIGSLSPDAVVAPSVTPSLLAAYEVMDGADAPPDRLLFYETGWREGLSEQSEDTEALKARLRFGGVSLRDSLFLLKRQPVFDWEPTEGKTLLCPVFDVPLVPLSVVVLLSGVENETDEKSFSTVFGLISSLATERFYIITYREAGGKPTHPVHTVAMLGRSGEKREEQKESSRPGIVEPQPKKKDKEGRAVVSEPLLYDAPLSPSALEKYHKCPRMFFFDYILKIPDEERPYTALGSILHRLLELHHRCELEDVRAEIERLLRSYEGFTEGERSLIRRDAETLFRNYLTSDVGKSGRTVETEMRFEFTIRGFRVVGRIDRVVETDGGYIAIDYKTRGKGKEKAHLNRIIRLVEGGKNVDFQAPLYIKALQEKGFSPVRAFSYIYLDFDNTFCPCDITLPFGKIEPYMGNVLNEVVRLIEKIREDTEFLPGEKPPCRSPWSPPCPYLGICTVKKVH